MSAKQITPGLFELSLGGVNVFFLQSDDGWTLIDTGFPNKADAILTAFGQMGHQPAEIRHIVITHAHPDHIGSLAELKRATAAATYIHPVDAPIARTGSGFRPLTPAPGLLNNLLYRLIGPLMRSSNTVKGAVIDYEINDGDVLPIAGGLIAIHTPGHCAGHLAFLWPQGRVLFVGDACSNLLSLGWTIVNENIQVAKQSLEKLAKLDFDVACFGHGKVIKHGASERFRKRWL